MRPVLRLLLCPVLVAVAALSTGCATSSHFRCDLPLPLEPPAASAGAEAEPPARTPCPARSPAFRPTNLVFQGGGVKGIAYVGALQTLEDLEVLPGVKRVAGTSAGAITATVVALGYSPEEVERIMFALDFERLEDGGGTGGVLRVFRRYGYFKGDYFLEWMRCMVRGKTGNPHTTFRELEAAGKFRELRLFTTDVNTGATQELSARATPDLEVALAARMSMSIPLFFASVEHPAFGPEQGGERHVFVDGGVLFNYPISAFDGNELNRETLGFVLMDTEHAEPPARIDSLLSYSRALVEADLNVQVDQLKFQRPNLVRTAVMDDLGVPTTDFRLSDTVKRKLVRSGAECTCRYFEGRPPKLGDFEAMITSPLASEPVPEESFERCGWVLGD